VLGDLPALALNLNALRRTFDQDRIGIVDVHVEASPGNAFECGKGTILPVDGHMPHAAASLGTGSARDHLFVAKELAVEKHDVGTLTPLRLPAGPSGGARPRASPAHPKWNAGQRHSIEESPPPPPSRARGR